MKHILGIDVGATYVKYGVFTSGKLKLKQNDQVETAKNLPDFVTQILDISHNRVRPYSLQAIGIGIPAFISKRESRIDLSPNIKFLNEVNLQRELRSRTYLPLRIENDANLAALGEYFSLSKPRPESFVHLTLGTGVGSGIILNGRLWRGECGYAGELGHIPVNSEGRPCGCGSSGCLETESSEKGIVRSYQEFSGDERPVTAQEIYHRWRSHDPAARKAFDRAGFYLGVLFTVIAHFFNPPVISIGGGVAAAGKAILDPAVKEFKKRIYGRSFQCTHIRIAQLGNQAGMIGAAYLVHTMIP